VCLMIRLEERPAARLPCPVTIVPDLAVSAALGPHYSRTYFTNLGIRGCLTRWLVMVLVMDMHIGNYGKLVFLSFRYFKLYSSSLSSSSLLSSSLSPPMISSVSRLTSINSSVAPLLSSSSHCSNASLSKISRLTRALHT